MAPRASTGVMRTPGPRRSPCRTRACASCSTPRAPRSCSTAVDDIVPGPYTYRRFWFRDACLIVHALLAAGYVERARSALARFPARQKAGGYFQSQEGEWDSNGQVLWAYGALRRRDRRGRCRRTGSTPCERGARWIRAQAPAAATRGRASRGCCRPGSAPSTWARTTTTTGTTSGPLPACARRPGARRRAARGRRASGPWREAASLRGDASTRSLATIRASAAVAAMPAAPGPAHGCRRHRLAGRGLPAAADGSRRPRRSWRPSST
ncbi:MAG: hypothetical protein U5K43_06880 [Halofilum sp. (in: g-proteobacteria)]|nr:hypothetical protein [Halofilum sp. (in: g-proteobacteria)]